MSAPTPEHPELWHPTWCSPEHCRAGADTPMQRHHSAPTLVDAELGDPRIRLWLEQPSDEAREDLERSGLPLPFGISGHAPGRHPGRRRR